MQERSTTRMQSVQHEQPEAAAISPVELQRESAANIHPLQSSSSGPNNEISNKSSVFAARINSDMGSSLSPSAALRRQPSLVQNFGSLEDNDKEKGFDDPLLGMSSIRDPLSNPLSSEDTLSVMPRSSRRTTKSASDERAEAAAAEWDGYKASIMQRFTSSGTITVSSNFDIISKESKGRGKSVTATHLQVLEDPEKEAREEVKIISQQEYVTRLKELNEEISQAWLNNERVNALRLSIKAVVRFISSSVLSNIVRVGD